MDWFVCALLNYAAVAFIVTALLATKMPNADRTGVILSGLFWPVTVVIAVVEFGRYVADRVRGWWKGVPW